MLCFMIGGFSVSCSVWFFGQLAAALLFLTGRDGVLLITFSAAHEAAHLLAALLCGCRIVSLRLRAGAAELETAGMPGTLRRRMISAAGPAANLLLVALFALLGASRAAFWNAAIALCNLIPVGGSDGAALFGLRGDRRKGKATETLFLLAAAFAAARLFGAAVLRFSLFFLLLSLPESELPYTNRPRFDRIRRICEVRRGTGNLRENATQGSETRAIHRRGERSDL